MSSHVAFINCSNAKTMKSILLGLGGASFLHFIKFCGSDLGKNPKINKDDAINLFCPKHAFFYLSVILRSSNSSCHVNAKEQKA